VLPRVHVVAAIFDSEPSWGQIAFIPPNLRYSKGALCGRRCAALLCPGRCVGAHGVIVAAIARCGVSRAPIADWLREGKCRQLPGQMRR
jgi:hypothetical protein